MSTRTQHPRPLADRRPSRAPWVLLGLGLGGFVDGIVLHQVLQWHHLVSDTAGNPVTTVEGLETNTLADGLFHMVTWLLVAAGLAAALRSWRRRQQAPPARSQVGLLLVGWGLFNLVEGTLAHQVLGLHQVRDDLGGPLSWDLGFLALGLVLVLVGSLLHGSAPDEPAA